MSAVVEALNQISPRWLTLTFAIAWQSSLLIVIVGVIAKLLRRASPAVRYWLWQVVAIKLLLMPLWTATIPVPWPAERASSPSAPTHIAATPSQQTAGRNTGATQPNLPASRQSSSTASIIAATEPRLTWQSGLFLGWIAIIGLQIVRLAVQRRRLARLLQHCQPAPSDLAALVARVAETIGARRRPTILVADTVCSPFACGILRPAIVIPQSLLAGLTPSQLRQTVAHELAHVERFDLAWGWTVQLARIAYFFHPLVHWLAGRIRLERELACDQWVIHRGGHAPADYMQTLIQVVSHLSRTPREETTS
ncbi:MAG: M56 family metallopeptidase [Pirellulales bacterium]